MLKLQDFLTFDSYLTPSIIRIFYVLQLVLIALFCLPSILVALAVMVNSFLIGFFLLIATLIGGAIAAIAARIATEIIRVLFQNNEHLAVIRARAEGR